MSLDGRKWWKRYPGSWEYTMTHDYVYEGFEVLYVGEDFTVYDRVAGARLLRVRVLVWTVSDAPCIQTWEVNSATRWRREGSLVPLDPLMILSLPETWVAKARAWEEGQEDIRRILAG